jgi:hypothetical protein
MQTENNQPKISDETMKEIAKFFARTSIPRIIADMKKKEQKKEQKKVKQA